RLIRYQTLKPGPRTSKEAEAREPPASSPFRARDRTEPTAAVRRVGCVGTAVRRDDQAGDGRGPGQSHVSADGTLVRANEQPDDFLGRAAVSGAPSFARSAG